MYLDKPLHEYLDDLASGKPAPGGGSTAALCGAMAAALTCMVSQLTLSKASYAPVHPEIQRILSQSGDIREGFQQLIQKDIDAYSQLSASFKLPRTTEEEKSARTSAVQSALRVAAEVPLAMVEQSTALARLSLRVATIGNKNVLSDISTAAGLASCSGSGAAHMVRINLRSLKDVELREQLEQRLTSALTELTELAGQIVKTVEERA